MQRSASSAFFSCANFVVLLLLASLLLEYLFSTGLIIYALAEEGSSSLGTPLFWVFFVLSWVLRAVGAFGGITGNKIALILFSIYDILFGAFNFVIFFGTFFITTVADMLSGLCDDDDCPSKDEAKDKPIIIFMELLFFFTFLLNVIELVCVFKLLCCRRPQPCSHDIEGDETLSTQYDALYPK